MHHHGGRTRSRAWTSSQIGAPRLDAIKEFVKLDQLAECTKYACAPVSRYGSMFCVGYWSRSQYTPPKSYKKKYRIMSMRWIAWGSPSNTPKYPGWLSAMYARAWLLHQIMCFHSGWCAFHSARAADHASGSSGRSFIHIWWRIFGTPPDVYRTSSRSAPQCIRGGLLLLSPRPSHFTSRLGRWPDLLDSATAVRAFPETFFGLPG